MAYDKKKIYDQAVAAAIDHKLFFIEDVTAYLPCSRETFYRFFPIDCDKYDSIKTILENNKVTLKVEIREKLRKGDKAAELLALYKLICTDEERKALSMSYQKIEGDVKTNQSVSLTDDQLEKVLTQIKPNTD